MRFEACDNSPQFYRVRETNKALVEFLRYSVKQSLRYYEEGAWYIHVSQALSLSQLAYATQGQLNYAALPADIQMRIAEEKVYWRRGSPTPEWRALEGVSKAQAYEQLYLTPDAPEEVVKAVWRTLAKMHHPDRGGDEETFKKLQEAYEKVTSD